MGHHVCVCLGVADVDECVSVSETNRLCDLNEFCVNVIGSFKCASQSAFLFCTAKYYTSHRSNLSYRMKSLIMVKVWCTQYYFLLSAIATTLLFSALSLSFFSLLTW